MCVPAPSRDPPFPLSNHRTDSRTTTYSPNHTRDYLADRPLPEVSFERSVFLKHELERIAAGKPMEPLDEARYVVRCIVLGIYFVGGV